MTTEVYPRFLRLAAGKLIAVVATLAEYLKHFDGHQAHERKYLHKVQSPVSYTAARHPDTATCAVNETTSLC